MTAPEPPHRALERLARPALCPHLRKQLGRVRSRDGREQLMEKCLDCGANARGPGVWVARRELRCPVEDLPLFADYSKSPGSEEPVQRTLFEDSP